MTEQQPESISVKSAPLSTKNATDLSKWLGSKVVAGRILMVAEGLELSPSAESRLSDDQLSIDLTKGKMVVETSQQDLERLLMIVGNEIADEHGVRIQSASLSLKGINSRQVDWRLHAKAKRGLFSATVEVTGRLSVTDQFEAHLTGLDIKGQGVFGTVVAAFVRPHLREAEGKKFPIPSLIPGNVQIKDVRLDIGDRARLVAELDNSNITIPKRVSPTSANTASSEKPAASNRRNKKLDIYFVDTGSNSRVRAMIDSHLLLFKSFLANQNIFILSNDQSKETLQRQPSLIGADPMVMMVDTVPHVHPPGKIYGTRFCMGPIQGEAAWAENLQRLVQIVADGTPSGNELQVIIDIVELTAAR